MIVDAEQLPATPQAFQDYIARYFVEAKVLGKAVFVATIKVCGDNDYHRGTAPGHSVDLMHYKDGLAPGQTLNEWMRKAEGEILWSFAGGHDSDNVYYDDD